MMISVNTGYYIFRTLSAPVGSSLYPSSTSPVFPSSPAQSPQIPALVLSGPVQRTQSA